MTGTVCAQPADPVSLNPGTPDWGSASCGEQGRAARAGAMGPAGLHERLSRALSRRLLCAMRRGSHLVLKQPDPREARLEFLPGDTLAGRATGREAGLDAFVVLPSKRSF